MGCIFKQLQMTLVVQFVKYVLQIDTLAYVVNYISIKFSYYYQ